MNNSDFEKVVERRCELIKSVLISKAKEYASDVDRLHNFKVAGNLNINIETPEQALWGMLRKHLVSIIDIIANTHWGKYPAQAVRDEKIGDAQSII
jgi:hypothetical protein